MNYGEHSQGCVFILYSVDNKMDAQIFQHNDANNLDDLADIKLCSPKDAIYSRFGYSIITSSNDAGNLEIYIGAPTYGMNNVTYQGIVYYYESYVDDDGIIKFKV